MTGRRAVILTCVALFILTDIASGAILRKSDSDPDVLSKANRITIPFVENKGQLEKANILLYSDTLSGRISVNRDGSIGYLLANAGKKKQRFEIREKLGGAPKTAPMGERKAVTKANYFKGKDPRKWVTDIPTFNCVNMGEIYLGVSLKLQAHGNNVEKIFAVRPGADPDRIRLNVDGAKALRMTTKGELEVNTGAGSLRFTKPVAYQRIDGRKIPVEVAYSVKGRSYGFKLAAYDQTKELIIDPLITAVFQGSTETQSRVTCMATDSNGNIYVAGRSADHLAVLKYDGKLKELLASAIFADAPDDYHNYRAPNVYDIAVDSTDGIYLAGRTTDENFPVTEGAFDTEFTVSGYSTEASDGFVIKYNANLNTILASTYIGAGNLDTVFGLAVDPTGNVYVAGETANPVSNPSGNIAPFPTTEGAYDRAPGSFRKTKAFIARLDNNLQNLLASTLLGDTGDDDKLSHCAYEVAIDTDGNVVVAGGTQSKNFPITDNCADAKFQGDWEAFVSKFDPNLQNLLASTFLGGANEESVNVLKIQPDNKIVVAGWTRSSDFPVVQDNFDTSFNLNEDGFVTRLNSELTFIEASTFLGGDGGEQVSDMVIHTDGRVLVCGGTTSSDFPVTEDSYDAHYGGGYADEFYEGDGFLTVFDPSLKNCERSTFLGGHSADHVGSIVINSKDIVLAGETWSDDFPYMVEVAGDSDAFVCRFNNDDEPDPLPSAKPGHWLSENFGSASSFYFDIDICEDGTFTGMWTTYFCNYMIDCYLTDDASFKPVFGTIDFEKNTGTINMRDSEGLEEKCKDTPIVINKQSSDYLRISINPGEEIINCYGSTGTILYYQGESENGKCDGEPPKGPGENPGGGGGGGGCFMSMFNDRV
jgi:hypothetical protein